MSRSANRACSRRARITHVQHVQVAPLRISAERSVNIAAILVEKRPVATHVWACSQALVAASTRWADRRTVQASQVIVTCEELTAIALAIWLTLLEPMPSAMASASPLLASA